MSIRKAWPIIKVAASREVLSASSAGFGSRPVWHSLSELRAGREELDKAHPGVLPHVFARFPFPSSIPLRLLSDAGCNRPPCQEYTSDGQNMDSLGSRCKIVVVGDTQCGKTALLHVFAKDCYPEVSLFKVSTWTFLG